MGKRAPKISPPVFFWDTDPLLYPFFRRRIVGTMPLVLVDRGSEARMWGNRGTDQGFITWGRNEIFLN